MPPRFAARFRLRLALRGLRVLLFTCVLAVGGSITTHAGMIGAGTMPRSVALGDLNNDGALDIVAGTNDSSTVIVLSNGNGTFGSQIRYKNPSPLFGTVLADFNGDGRLDVANTGTAGMVAVRLGNGDGTLGMPGYVAVPNPAGLVAGDFNEDGRIDIAVVCSTNPQVSVLFGNGSGGFSAPVQFATTDGGWNLAVGDINQDGHLDLAIANTGGNGVTLLFGTGTGGFSAPVALPMSQAAISVVLADFNGDGHLDVAAAMFGTSVVDVRLGNGNGTFGPVTSYPTSTNPTFVAAGDLNGDGAPDLVASCRTTGVASVLLGNGAGGFAPRVDYPCGSSEWAAIGHLDGDGTNDIATAAYGSNSVCVLANNGNGTFPVPGGPVYVWARTSGTTAANSSGAWAPARSTITTNDVLVFNNGANSSIDWGNAQFGQLAVSGGTTANFVNSSILPVTLTLGGGPGTDLVVESGSRLTLKSSVAVELDLGVGASAAITGTVEFGTTTNRLQARDPNGIVFQSGGVAQMSSGAFVNPFGTGTGLSGLNSVLFTYGSMLVAGANVNPFGAAAPASVVTFLHGSRFRMDAAFTPDASGRTYADFEYNVPEGSSTMSGTGAFAVDSLILTQGNFAFGMTGPVTIRGNISVPMMLSNSGKGYLMFIPATPSTYTLAGSARQSVHQNGIIEAGMANLYMGPNVTLDVNNPAGVEFVRFWRTTASLHFTHGNVSCPVVPYDPFTQGTFAIAVDSTGTVTGASQSTGWVATQLIRRVTADGPLRLDVGDATTYTPVDVVLHGVTKSGCVGAVALAQDHTQLAGAQLDNAHLAHRGWLLYPADNPFAGTALTYLSSMDATFSFAPGDLSTGADPSQFVVRRYSSGSWFTTPAGARTATSISMPGLTAAEWGSYPSFQAGQPITPSLVVQNVAAPEGTGPVPARVRPSAVQTAGNLAFHVSLSQAAIAPVTVDYQTADGTATVADNDYTPQSGTLNFAPGDTAKDIVVPFGVDTTPERNETFGLALSNATNANIATPSVTGTILDDDDVTPPTAAVLYPNGGETVFVGATVALQWSATDNVAVSAVDLFVSRDDGKSYESIAQGVANTGTYAWIATGPVSTTMRFRVVARDDPGHTAKDASDAAWTLSSGPSGVGDLPLAFALAEFAPNPAPAGPTRIAFVVPQAMHVRLTVLDVQGRTVAAPASGDVPAGRNERTWDASRAAAGIYFVRLEAPGFRAERRVVVVR